MSKLDYRKLAEDFAFLKEYGYFFWRKNEHRACPSVAFRNNKEELEIGYRYDEHRIYAYRYMPAGSREGEDLLADIDTGGSSYKEQIYLVREALYSYLNNNRDNARE
ncbi:MAG: hypothetical protein ACLSVG_07815 [Clostridia bacterium]